jgi:Ca2+-transporting ATPase
MVIIKVGKKKMDKTEGENWYQLETQQVIAKLATSTEDGLSEREVALRLEKFGPNELIDRGVKSPWKILWEQLTGIMVLILIFSVLISLFLHEYRDAIVILVIVVLNAILGFTQEYRAEQAMAALKKMAVPKVRVRRGGHIREIDAQNLVPGDVILLEAGNAIPADCRLVESINLRVQESVLTGESEPIDKSIILLSGDHLPVGDQRNMIFMGTIVTYGRGEAVVTGTGMNSELGRIAEMIQSVDEGQTPLQRRLDQLGKGLAIVALGIVAIVFLLGVLRGESARLMFQTAISMAVAAVPEGLPAVVTIALAIGAQRMLGRQALIRKLPAVETLGSVTVICSDKTGTLTENRMTVTVLDVAGNKIGLQQEAYTVNPSDPSDQGMIDSELLRSSAVSLLLVGGALCNDAILESSERVPGSYDLVGDPTEGALVVAAARAGLWKKDLDEALPRKNELPFDSERKRMTTLHEFAPGNIPDALKPIWDANPAENELDYIVITKGAVDSLLQVSDRVWVENKVMTLDKTWRNRILEANDLLAQEGMRVLGVTFRNRQTDILDEDNDPLENNLIFVGLFGMIDPARPEVREAVRMSKTAGIHPIMITGDHPLTALHIARELGITEQSEAVTGQELADITVESLQEKVEDVSVYARVSPEHKLKIVQALQNRGHIVAMTGDGVNDAPALKRADIGVAMGITGTDVSKEASDMVLLDDNFATIVTAVKEGRRIYDNIRKFIKYTMTSNTGEIWVMLVAPFLGMPLPLTPIHILWINLVTDGLPGLALTVEPEESKTMERPPHPPDESIFGRGMVRDILWIGLLIGFICLGIGYVFFNENITSWQTMVFTTLTLTQMGNAMALRSEHDSLFQIGLFSNKAMLGSVLLTFVMQLGVIYIPFLQSIFKTVSLTAGELGISIGLGFAVFLCIELVKWVKRRRTR